MKPVRLLIPFLLCIIMAMSGCGTKSTSDMDGKMTTVTAADQVDMSDGAALYIMNISGWTMVPKEQVVLDNGNELVSLPRKTFARVGIAPGNHEFGFPYRKQPTLNLDAVKGETYYIQVDFKPESSWAYAQEGDPIYIKQLTETEAGLVMQKLEPAPAQDKTASTKPADEKQAAVQQTEPMMQKSELAPVAPKTEEAQPAPPAVAGKKTTAEAMKQESQPMQQQSKPEPPAVKKEMAAVSPAGMMKTGDSAQLVLFNVSGWTLMSRDQTVIDNGKELVTLPRKTYEKIAISPGSHVLGLQDRGKTTLDIDALKGETYYVSIGVKTESSWVSPSETDPVEIRLLTNEEASALMKEFSQQ